MELKTTLMIMSLFLSQVAHAQECRLRTPVRLPQDPFVAKTAARFKGVLLDKIPEVDIWRRSEIVNGQLQVRIFELRTAETHPSDSVHGTGMMAASFTSDLPDGRNDLGQGFAELYVPGGDFTGETRVANGETTYTTVEALTGDIHKQVRMTIKDGYVLALEFKLAVENAGRLVRPIQYQTACVLDMHE